MIEIKSAQSISVGKDSDKNQLTQHVLLGFENELADVRTEEKRKILNHYFTNIDGNVRAIKNMPSVIAAALLARFSRAEETDVTEVFWDDFVKNEILGTSLVAKHLVEEEGIEEALAQEKAKAMIKRIIDGYGDDSVREQASEYLVIQNASVLSSLEVYLHPKISGIEASTRYIPWGERDKDGNFRYVRPTEIMNSKHAQMYTEAMDFLFVTYQELWQSVWDYVSSKTPKPEGMKDSDYYKAVKGRVCDNLRKLLPLGIRTNFGIHADMRTLSEVIMNLRASDNSETRALGNEMEVQLAEVNSEFVAIANNEKGGQWTQYQKEQKKLIKNFSQNIDSPAEKRAKRQSVTVEVLNEDPILDLAKAIIIYDKPWLKGDLLTKTAQEKIANGDLDNFLQLVEGSRKNRRHKAPDVYSAIKLRTTIRRISFGSFKDFNRQRKVEWKSSPDWRGESGIYIPEDIKEMGGEVLDKYILAQKKAQRARRVIAKDMPYHARLLLTHGVNTSVVIDMGMTEAIWIEELRSIATGDPEYRWFAQEMNRQRIKALPALYMTGSFTNFNDYPLNRLGEISRAVIADTMGKQ